MKIELEYFKPSGKYYSSGSIEVDKELVENYRYFVIYDTVRALLKARILPGLIEGHSYYHVYVHGPDTVPALIMEPDIHD